MWLTNSLIERWLTNQHYYRSLFVQESADNPDQRIQQDVERFVNTSVMHTNERLAALIPYGAALVLNTIRWDGEIRPLAELKLPAEGKTAAGLKPGQLKMAAQLIGDMTGPWKSDDYSDKFSDAILALVSKKVEAGETATVTTLEETPAEAGASNVVDLSDLLAKSLAQRRPGPSAKDGRTVATKKSAPKTSTIRRV